MIMDGAVILLRRPLSPSIRSLNPLIGLRSRCHARYFSACSTACQNVSTFSFHSNTAERLCPFTYPALGHIYDHLVLTSSAVGDTLQIPYSIFDLSPFVEFCTANKLVWYA